MCRASGVELQPPMAQNGTWAKGCQGSGWSHLSLPGWGVGGPQGPSDTAGHPASQVTLDPARWEPACCCPPVRLNLELPACAEPALREVRGERTSSSSPSSSCSPPPPLGRHAPSPSFPPSSLPPLPVLLPVHLGSPLSTSSLGKPHSELCRSPGRGELGSPAQPRTHPPCLQPALPAPQQ